MAYADYEYYTGTYYGDVLTEANAAKWLSRSSDELDTLTFGRLTFAMPTVDAHVQRVKKAVCAMAEALFHIDEQEKAASAQKQADGSYRGAVGSVTSGKESISYRADSSAALSYAAAAASPAARLNLLRETAARYIAGIPDAEGVNLLYAGIPTPRRRSAPAAEEDWSSTGL